MRETGETQQHAVTCSPTERWCYAETVASYVDRLARWRHESDPDADDLRQDIWLELLVSRPRTDSSIRPWLGVVARRSDYARGRRDALRRRSESSYAAELAEKRHAVAQESIASVKLSVALGRMNEPDRDILQMRYAEGLSFEEIGRRIGAPTGRARGQHFRIISALRRTILGGQTAGEDPGLGPNTRGRSWVAGDTH